MYQSFYYPVVPFQVITRGNYWNFYVMDNQKKDNPRYGVRGSRIGDCGDGVRGYFKNPCRRSALMSVADMASLSLRV